MSGVTFILFSLLLSSIMLCAIFLMAWRTMGRKAHALTWSMAFAVAILQWSGNLLKGSFPSHDFYWLTVNACSVITVSLGLLGHRQRTSRSTAYWQLLLPGLIVYFLICWVTLVQPNAGLKLAIAPSYTAVLLSFCTWTLLRYRARPTPAEWGAATSNFILALSQAAAVAPLLLQGANPDPISLKLYSTINFMIMPAAYIGMGMFVVFILASDLSEEMKKVAVRDQLTGVFNRRGLADATQRLFSHSQRLLQPLSVVLADIDRFKEINDRYGHAVGDQALLEFSQLLAGGRRVQDVLARVGGEEFVLVLPGMKGIEAVAFAEQLRQRVEAMRVDTPEGQIALTASFGVASRSEVDDCFEEVLQRADHAMYQSKADGRNRVQLENRNVTKSGPAVQLAPMGA